MSQKNAKLSPEELMRILKYSYDEIFITNADGIVVYVNDSCINHYGCPAEKMIGKRSAEMTEQNLWGPRLSLLAKKYKKVLTRKQTSCTGVVMLTTAIPIYGKNGEVEYVLENVRNITEGQGLKRDYEETELFFKNINKALDQEEKVDLKNTNIIAQSNAMRQIIKNARRMAEINSNILITGDSGAGKSLIAHYIHEKSQRHNGPFIEINCAALPESLVESELFGYTKGAFSGAVSQGKKGLIHAAENGTLFLDEIGELPYNIQAKLLHFIQEGKYFEVGGTTEKHSNCRIIAATNRNLQDMVENKSFRQDLYYRLKVFEIVIPPLSQRNEDVIPLIQFYLTKYNKKYDLHREISPHCIQLLAAYPWPGNVRELANTIEQIVVMSQDNLITENSLTALFQRIRQNIESTENYTIAQSYAEQADKIEQKAEEEFRKLYREMHRELGSSRKIAKALGISDSAAYRNLKKYCPDSLK